MRRVPPIDAASDQGDRLPSLQGEVELRHVTFRYPARPEVTVFDDFSLHIPAGSTVALVGESGSGKVRKRKEKQRARRKG
jgi:ATP-binding cassette, subfamily B (MDR/TAP), member 1